MKDIQSSGKLEQKLSQFSEAQRKLIMQNVGAIELTEGCSVGCPDCGVSALKGVRDYIPYETLKNIFTDYSSELKSTLMLYYASEPFDYYFDGKEYMDIHNMFKDKVGKDLSVITAFPKGKEKELLEKMIEEASKDFKDKIIKAASLTPFNYKRVEKKFLESDLPNKIGVGSLSRFTNYINARTEHYNPIRDFVNEKERSNLSSNDEELADESISCFHGVLLTPSKIYNLITVKPSQSNPNGVIKIPIKSEDFKVMPFASCTGISNDAFLADGEEDFLRLD